MPQTNTPQQNLRCDRCGNWSEKGCRMVLTIDVLSRLGQSKRIHKSEQVCNDCMAGIEARPDSPIGEAKAALAGL